MEREQVLHDLRMILDETVGINVDSLREDMSFEKDFDIDSLTMVEIVFIIEGKYNIKIDEDDFSKLLLIKDVVNYIQDKIKEKEGSSE